MTQFYADMHNVSCAHIAAQQVRDSQDRVTVDTLLATAASADRPSLARLRTLLEAGRGSDPRER